MAKRDRATADSLVAGAVPVRLTVSSTRQAPLHARIGKYEVDAEIGSGSRIKVFSAIDPQTGRRVTLKLLMEVTDAALSERFRRELALAARITNPAFAAIYEVGEHVGFTFAAMQRAGEDDMRQVLKRVRFLSLFQKMSMMWEVAEAARAAHEAGLAYIGIRPSAIALSEQEHALIQDFGIIRSNPEDQAERAAYASPEEAEGDAPGPLCDIFAFGALYYHLFTGRHPFPSADNGSAGAPEAESPALLAEAGCPEALEKVVRRAIARQCALRYQSFEEIQEDIEPVFSELRRERAATLVENARALVDAGDLEQAQTVVREALDSDPHNAQADRLRAGIRSLLKRQMAKPRIETLLKAAEEARSAGEYDRADEILDSTPELSAADSEAASRIEEMRRRIADSRQAVRLVAEARRFMEQGRWEDAELVAYQALAAAPEDGATADLLRDIDLASRRRQTEERIEHGLVRAKSLLLLESFDDAIGVLTELKAECPGFPAIDEWIDRVNGQKAAAERKAQIESRLHEIRAQLGRGEFDPAIKALEELAERFPEAEVSDLALQARKARQHEALVTQALEESGWLLSQGRPDVAAQFLREKAEALGSDPRFAARLSEAEATFRDWETRRSIEECLRQVVALEQMKQWSVALTVLEEALSANPASGELLATAERLRGRLLEQQHQHKLGRRLEAIRHKITAQDWSQALALIEAARLEIPGEPELDALEQTARAAMARARAETIASDVRQCIADGEADRADLLLQKGLEEFAGEPLLVSLREQVEANKHFRSEWRNAHVLFVRRQFEKAEEILVRLVAEDRPEVQALLELVREGRAATEEDQFYKRGLDKALNLIEENQFDPAADLIRNLLSLFPGDPILERHLASAMRGAEKSRPAPKPAPVSITQTPDKTDKSAGRVETGPAAPYPLDFPALPGGKRNISWIVVSCCGMLPVLIAAAVWYQMHGKPPANILLDRQVESRKTPSRPRAKPTPMPETNTPENADAAASAPVDARAPARAAPVSRNRGAVVQQKSAASKPLRAFNPSALRGQQAGVQAGPLPAPPAGVIGRPGPESAAALTDLLGHPTAPPAPPAARQPAAASAKSDFRPAAPVSHRAPELPVFARQHGIYGAVELEAVIDHQGVVRDVRTVKGNPVLADAARQAVLKWRYQPATLNGQAVESKLTVRVLFEPGK